MSSSHSVFTYGTLQITEVMKLVTGLELPSVPARLNGYQCLKIKNRTYPGIIKNPSQFIDGILYKKVGDHALKLLDQFEDVLYERCLVDVVDETQQAFVYVIKDQYKYRLADKPWSLDEFKLKYLNKYLRDINSW
jgi:gamma-glutamylcyclotransferase (GGCT)/AIG2-like uncharacterized protein YtfP